MNFLRCKINNAVLKNNFQQNHEEVQQILSITPLRFSINKIFADKHAPFVDRPPPLPPTIPKDFCRASCARILPDLLCKRFPRRVLLRLIKQSEWKRSGHLLIESLRVPRLRGTDRRKSDAPRNNRLSNLVATLVCLSIDFCLHRRRVNEYTKTIVTINEP